MENAIENNKLFAEFMGWEKSLDPENMYDFPENFNDPLTKDYHCISVALMQFDKSWDWLMPVISKITCMQEFWDWEFNSLFWDVFNQLDITEVYGQVVRYIQWYNKTA